MGEISGGDINPKVVSAEGALRGVGKGGVISQVVSWAGEKVLNNSRMQAVKAGIDSWRDEMVNSSPSEERTLKKELRRKLFPHEYDDGRIRIPSQLRSSEGYAQLILNERFKNPDFANALSQLYRPMLYHLRGSGLDDKSEAMIEKGLMHADKRVVLKLAVEYLQNLQTMLSPKELAEMADNRRTARVMEYDAIRGFCGEIIRRFSKELGLKPGQVRQAGFEEWVDYLTLKPPPPQK